MPELLASTVRTGTVREARTNVRDRPTHVATDRRTHLESPAAGVHAAQLPTLTLLFRRQHPIDLMLRNRIRVRVARLTDEIDDVVLAVVQDPVTHVVNLALPRPARPARVEVDRQAQRRHGHGRPPQQRPRTGRPRSSTTEAGTATRTARRTRAGRRPRSFSRFASRRGTHPQFSLNLLSKWKTPERPRDPPHRPPWVIGVDNGVDTPLSRRFLNSVRKFDSCRGHPKKARTQENSDEPARNRSHRSSPIESLTGRTWLYYGVHAVISTAASKPVRLTCQLSWCASWIARVISSSLCPARTIVSIIRR
jgi:hypothetical protein